MIFNLIATTIFGLESICASELKSLGFEGIIIENGRVRFRGDFRDLAMANLSLRTAERVYILVGEFHAQDTFSFDDYHDAIRAMPWEIFLHQQSAFPVYAASVKSGLSSVPALQSVAKAAIVKRIRKVFKREYFDENEERVKIHIHVIKNHYMALIDTSGVGLHKRGYRAHGNRASISETLAAGLIQLTKWHPDIMLIDPMCGSGTILIEAAMMKANIAPGLRRSFDYEHWQKGDMVACKEARQEVKERYRVQGSGKIEGYDLHKGSIKQALINAEKAGVGSLIHFQVRDVANFSTKLKKGTILSNPPYGVRMQDQDEAAGLYQIMGKQFEAYPYWSKYFITAHPAFEKAYGTKATKNRKLYNGNMKAYFYMYYGAREQRK